MFRRKTGKTASAAGKAAEAGRVSKTRRISVGADDSVGPQKAEILQKSSANSGAPPRWTVGTGGRHTVKKGGRTESSAPTV